ncbi:hypothetical protein MMC31_001150 [Peltigera leucophlebia]|nr:hypothetical protein [Peltigera leucophlebia]
MPPEQILRIHREDQQGGIIFVNVSSNGPLPLDLKLLATDGLDPFVLNLGQHSARKFRGCSSKLDDKEWEDLLETFFLQQSLNGNKYAAEPLGTLEASATISEESLLLVFRKSISGIKQRLGELALEKNENEEIELFGWLGTATARSDELVEKLTNLDDRYKEQGQTIQVIKQQLEDLIEAKVEHENSLLEKFRELLNAKKLKIRDLHRALAVARADSENAIQTEETQEQPKPKASDSKRITRGKPRGGRGRGRGTRTAKTAFTHSGGDEAGDIDGDETSPDVKAPTASHSIKRKAKSPPAATLPSASESGEETASESRSIDQDQDQPINTPERSDGSETEAEDEDLDTAPVAQPAKNSPSQPATRSRAPAKAQARAPTPPPRRELPFASKVLPTRQQSQVQIDQAMDLDDDETSDDEL